MDKVIGSAQTSDARVKELSIGAVIIRADGTREDLGVISRTKFGPLDRFSKFMARCYHDARRLIGV